jgi:hypothetical protein
MPININGNIVNSSIASTLNYKSIVTRGLSIHFDASAKDSYPETGNSWFDLVTSATGTLTNGPTYSSSNGGSILFDGTNDRVSTGLFPTGVRSYMIWIKYNSATGTGGYQLTGTQQGDAYTYTGRLDNGNPYTYGGSGGNGGATTGYTLNTATWYYQGFTLSANGDLAIYLNGSLIETKTGNGLGSTPTSEFSIGCINTNHFVNGNIAVVHLYDRVLSTAEVLQNYNAQKSRFGL